MTTRLRYLAIIEGTTYLILLGALAWRTFGDGPDLSAVTGLTHGLVFLAYCAAVLVERTERRWPVATTASALAASVIPLGGYYVADRLLDTDE